MSYQSQTVARLLGLPEADRATAMSLAGCIEEGMPISALEQLAHSIAPSDPDFACRIVPTAPDRRRSRSARALSVEEGNRVVRLANVFAFAIDAFGSEERARTFLKEPHPMLDGQSALDVTLATEPGADAVINIIGRAAYGAAA